MRWMQPRHGLAAVLASLVLTVSGLAQAQGNIGKLPQDFENAVNNPRWRDAHMNIGVIRGIFT